MSFFFKKHFFHLCHRNVLALLFLLPLLLYLWLLLLLMLFLLLLLSLALLLLLLLVGEVKSYPKTNEKSWAVLGFEIFLCSQ